MTAVERGTERAEIDQIEAPAGWIPPNSRVFPRHIVGRDQLDVYRELQAASSDRGPITDEVVLMVAGLVAIAQPGVHH
jgi:hypothetical protein